MAELTIRPEEIREALDRFVQNYTPSTSSREEVGTVVTSGDGIARVEGLPSAMANELLEFENGTLGIALNLDVREIGVVVMGDSGGHRGGPGRQADRRHLVGAGRRRLPRPRRSTRWATRSTGWARSPTSTSVARSSCRRPA